VPVDHPDQPYAGQLVAFDGGHQLIGTVWCDDVPDRLCDPIPVHRSGDQLRAG